MTEIVTTKECPELVLALERRHAFGLVGFRQHPAYPKERIAVCYNLIGQVYHQFSVTLMEYQALTHWGQSKQGGLLQDAVPHMSIQKREMCISGMNDAEFDAITSEKFDFEEKGPFI